MKEHVQHAYHCSQPTAFRDLNRKRTWNAQRGDDDSRLERLGPKGCPPQGRKSHPSYRTKRGQRLCEASINTTWTVLGTPLLLSKRERERERGGGGGGLVISVLANAVRMMDTPRKIKESPFSLSKA